jgi:hypothetical protein
LGFLVESKEFHGFLEIPQESLEFQGFPGFLVDSKEFHRFPRIPCGLQGIPHIPQESLGVRVDSKGVFKDSSRIPKEFLGVHEEFLGIPWSL